MVQRLRKCNYERPYGNDPYTTYADDDHNIAMHIYTGMADVLFPV